jgi:hypothetical protein
MSNTWDYRFAFRAERRDDVPVEFRGAYDRLLEAWGRPIFGLFSPAMEDPGFILSRWHPPKLILVFSESCTVLSLDRQSDQVATFELNRQDFLGYGVADFLLNCWLMLYPGVAADSAVQIRFPSRACQHYGELARLLLNWLECRWEPSRNEDPPSRAIPGLPPKFLSCLEAHIEFGPPKEFFVQPALEIRKKQGGKWANLLLVITPKGIVALTDQYRRECSPYGIEITYLPLARVRSVDWCESNDGHRTAIEVHLEGVSTRLCKEWPILPGLSPYALRWIEAVKPQVKVICKEYSRADGLMG